MSQTNRVNDWVYAWSQWSFALGDPSCVEADETKLDVKELLRYGVENAIEEEFTFRLKATFQSNRQGPIFQTSLCSVRAMKKVINDSCRGEGES